MVSLLSIIAVGFFLGMRHATDPDHVIAVTTIVSRQRDIKRAALTGLFWGVGHTLTILVVGAAIILLGFVIPARLGLSMELSVGLMLVVLGLMNLASFLRSASEASVEAHDGSAVAHSHPHIHGDYIHSHPQAHGPEVHPHRPDQTPLAYLDRMLGRIGLYQHLRPLIVGVVHGLAGSAAVALLVLAAIKNPRWAIAYLLVFGVGTIAGMMLITVALVFPFAYTANDSAWMNRNLRMASGLVSLGLGIFVVYQIGIVYGLFSAHPRWTPK